ncbi:hypothetical protein BKA67DRAFT_659096 [Truncatella angustata]|uniref:Uncharacterized protein n=1 Tax=Truncatella angustata TaxID=152316 RepID=A0A9P8ZYB3_9PEZI|nr:uncharacterized protein BKA67DRAFT_659096 [Truncatella angustata]KAH6654829.1 hypothetical protein BKA67DRAFT_659096 [Truncatella angustata]
MATTALKAEPIHYTFPEQLDLEARDLDLEKHSIELRTIRIVPVLATFEDRTPQSGPKTALGVYKGLNFQGMTLIKAGVGVDGDIISGVVPYSRQNTVGLPIVPLGGVGAAITTTYAGSNAVSFDLNSLWFGCVLGTVDNVVSAPINCKIAVGGYDGTGKRIGFEQFIFTPPALSLRANMIQARFDNTFKGVSRVVITTTYESIRQLGVTLMDNIDYIVSANITK